MSVVKSYKQNADLTFTWLLTAATAAALLPCSTDELIIPRLLQNKLFTVDDITLTLIIVLMII